MKEWQMVTRAPLTTANGGFFVSDKFNLAYNSSPAYYMAAYASVYRYDGDEDSWIQIPASGLAGVFGAGACGEYRQMGAMGGIFTQTATAGSAGSITTNRTIVKLMTNRRIRVIAGTGVGFDGFVLNNTLGANAVISVKDTIGATTASATVFDATTQFQAYTGSLWVQGAGASAGFAVYDVATNTWTQKTAVGVSWGTDGQIVSTVGSESQFYTGTASSGAASTLTESSKAWNANQWANYQVRITGGTGKGQIRTIASNTGTALTVSANWTVNPDNTSVYAIEGNDDYFYLMGNNAVTLYRFSVATGTWTTLSPAAARAAAPGGGATLNWIDGASTWTLNTNGSSNLVTTGLYKQNGRYLLSFRGGGTNTLDAYDIAANTWISGLPYGFQTETFTTGSSSCDYKGNIFIQKEATTRFFRFSVDEWSMQSLAQHFWAQGATVTGNKMALLIFSDTGELPILFSMGHTTTDMYRLMLI
ncbi:MAG: hypothetical protein E6Q36_08380 [Chryseobacterium sp.]|nr:MAG: hypothetical protein E6Q36_08380 [Chryseobacterium sp.]